MLSVTITAPGREPEILRLDKPEVTIGRHAQNDVVLPRHNISKIHARIRQNGQGAIVVVDNGSTNGTIINGKRISAPTTLQPGDKIIVGEYVIEVAAGTDDSRKQDSLPQSQESMRGASSKGRASAPAGPGSDLSPIAIGPVLSKSGPVDTSPNPAPSATPSIPSFDDDWDKMEPIDPTPSLSARDGVSLEPLRDVPETTSNPGLGASGRETVKLSGPDEPNDVAAKAALLAECLRCYVEIDEFRHARSKGKACQCGECLLCRSRLALSQWP